MSRVGALGLAGAFAFGGACSGSEEPATGTGGVGGSSGIGGVGGSGGGGSLDVERVQAGCQPRSLQSEDGSLPCSVVEVNRDVLVCDLPPRAAISDRVSKAVRAEHEKLALCSGIECDALSMCEVKPAEPLSECLNNVAPDANLRGYCYLDASLGLGAETILAQCPETMRRTLRFVGTGVPTPSATLYLACSRM